MNVSLDTQLKAEVRPISQCDMGLIHRLFAIYQTYYAPTDLAVFTADFRAKSWAIVLVDAQGREVGFSTIADHVDLIEGQRVRCLFSGDTIIDRAYWGTQALPYRWIELAGQIKASDPTTPLYWLLISKGHRTYRYMPGFTFDHYPHPEHDTPADVAQIMSVLGTRRFGAAFDPTCGIVRPGDLPTRLRDDFDGVAAAGQNRYVKFFNTMNPGYAHGDELLCLCELSADNLRPRARRQFLRGMLDAA